MAIQHGNIIITKASGEKSSFLPEKLRRSLHHAGANKETIEAIMVEIESDLYDGISTGQIYKTAFRLLKNRSGPLAARYKLKAAIMELGPSGFPFEKYVATILQEQGYRVQTGVIVQGKCVKHEVDVIAERAEQHFMIECKYHNQPGTVCDVKIPLYIHSRFNDVKAGLVQLPDHDVKLHQGWVVTNTRFTSDAIQYGLCAGLHLLGWNYPVKGSLNEQIDNLGLYPVTCLTTLSRNEKQKLLDNKIVLCREICEHPEVLKQAGVSKIRLKSVLEEGHQLCHKLYARH